jgi:hypothetical protein
LRGKSSLRGENISIGEPLIAVVLIGQHLHLLSFSSQHYLIHLPHIKGVYRLDQVLSKEIFHVLLPLR